MREQQADNTRTRPVQFGENDKLPDIRYDNVFKAVFTRDTPASRGALSNLISTLIRRVITVKAISANEPPADSVHDRSIRFDIACKAESGELVNIEMSLYPAIDELVRIEFYEAKLFSGQHIRGVEKSFSDLKETIQITILGGKQFFDDDVLVHTFRYYDPEYNISLNGKTRIITMELSKVERVIEKPAEEMVSQEAWGAFFEYLTVTGKREKINDILKKEAGIAMAGETLITITEDERELARLTTQLKNELDYQSGMVNARREGIRKGLQKGLKEGRSEGLRETAKNLKALGISTDVISQSTGLTPEEIAGL